MEKMTRFLVSRRQPRGPDDFPVMQPRDTRLNTPAEMLVRLVFAARYFLFFAGAFFSASALHHGSVQDALKASVCFAAMVAGHRWLKRGNKIAGCDRALDAMFRGDTAPDDGDGLCALLSRRDELERRRGMPGFDPWEVQAVRREISDYVKAHPESTARFDGRR
jgi:hypothetical protein